MARTAIAITDATAANPANVQIVTVASDNVNGNMFPNDGRTVLVLNNSTGGALTVTVASIADRFGRSDSAFTSLSVAAGVIRMLGPFPQAVWNQVGSDIGNVYVNTSGSGLQVQAIRLAAAGYFY